MRHQTISTASHEISVRIFTSVNDNRQYQSTITPYLDNYRHTVRKHGGYWVASWNLIMPSHLASAFFRQNLNAHVETYHGGSKVWEGFINEMNFTQFGVTRRAATESIRNAVRCLYTDTSDNQRKTTAWYTNTPSIQKYGRIEETVFLDNVETAAADAYAQSVIANTAWPFPELVNITSENTDLTTLSVNATGYVFTANYRYVSRAPEVVTVSNMVNNIVTIDCEFLTMGSLGSNAVPVNVPSHDISA